MYFLMHIININGNANRILIFLRKYYITIMDIPVILTPQDFRSF